MDALLFNKGTRRGIPTLRIARRRGRDGVYVVDKDVQQEVFSLFSTNKIKEKRKTQYDTLICSIACQ